ncbi:MAG TPA: acetyl-CoA carboxylase biotin carboxyl carrier protein [Flavitalea sp.]|nr:acetyl-CoA carboxylase biotin carboxyl carrier protein [Flavitalea sp.]
MDFKQIQELIKMINKSNIGEVTIEEKGFRLTIKQKEEAAQHLYTAPQMTAPAPQQVLPAAAPAPSGSAASTPSKGGKPETATENYLTIKSPMIGTFYRSPGPGKPQFLEVGDEVTPGKVVCIIEAMKLFNEIESEVKGRIVKVLVEDASPVEYDQPLFLVEP